MKAQSWLKGVGVYGMVVGVFALAPVSVLAQQEKASQGQTQQAPVQQEASQPKTEVAQSPTTAGQAPETPQGQTDGTQAQGKDPKVISGMSILGNQEAPKALVIVPWKQSELGNALNISTMLDDSRSPVDKEVFMRMLNYYEIRSSPVGASTKTNAAQTAIAAQGRK